jgi:hypothetical protein
MVSLSELKRMVKDALEKYTTQKQNKQSVKIHHFPSLRQFTIFTSSSSPLSPFQKANVQRLYRRAKADVSEMSLTSYPKLYEVIEQEDGTSNPRDKRMLMIFTSTVFPKHQSPLLHLPSFVPSQMESPFVVGMLFKQGKIVAVDILRLPPILPSFPRNRDRNPFFRQEQQIMTTTSTSNKKKGTINPLKRL